MSNIINFNERRQVKVRDKFNEDLDYVTKIKDSIIKQLWNRDERYQVRAFPVEKEGADFKFTLFSAIGKRALLTATIFNDKSVEVYDTRLRKHTLYSNFDDARKAIESIENRDDY